VLIFLPGFSASRATAKRAADMGDANVANNLRQVRRANGDYTQQDLADICGCTRQTIVALEQNKYNPSLALALKIAGALNAKVEDIFHLDNK